MQQNVYMLSSYLTRKKSSHVLFYSLRKNGQWNAYIDCNIKIQSNTAMFKST